MTAPRVHLKCDLIYEIHVHGSAEPHQSCKLRCVCCWVPTDLSVLATLSSTSLECTQTPSLLSSFYHKGAHFVNEQPTANSMMVFPVTFTQLDSPSRRQGLRKELVRVTTARWAEVWEKNSRELSFFFHESPRRNHPFLLCSCLPSLYGHIGFCSAGKFYYFCCSAPALLFFVAMNRDTLVCLCHFPTAIHHKGPHELHPVLHPPFLLLLTMAFLV